MSQIKLTARIVGTEIRFGFVRVIRYPVKTVIDSLVLYVVFLGIALGIKAIAPYPMPGAELAGALAGFLLWYWVLMAIDAMGQSVAEDTQVGTLEQVVISGLDLRLVLFGRFISMLVTGSLMMFLVLSAVMLSTGARLHCDLVGGIMILLVILIVTLGLTGLGYLIASMVLMVKKLGNLMGLLQFGLLFLILTPIDRLHPVVATVFRGIPLVWGSDLIASIIGSNIRPSSSDLIGLTVVSCCWITVGALVFKKVESSARARGLLGHY